MCGSNFEQSAANIKAAARCKVCTLSLLKFSPLWNLALALVSEPLILSSLQPVSSLALTLAYFLLGGGRLFAVPPMGFACKGILLHTGQEWQK